MAETGKGDKGRGAKSRQGATSGAAKTSEHAGKPLLGECSLPGAKQGPGRPTTYQPIFCETVVELGRKGYSKAMIAYDLNVSRNTIDNWADEHPEFLCAINHAREFALGWWEAQGHMGIWSKDFNSNAYRLQVTNRFPDDWKDKQTQELTGKDGGAINITRVELVPLGDGTD